MVMAHASSGSPNCAEHDLGMIAARHGLLDAHRRAARDPGEQQRRLDLRRGGDVDEVDCPERAAVDGDRQTIAALEPRAHPFERRGHAPHRALRQRGVAGQRDAEPVDPRAGAEQQPRRGAAIAAVDRRRRGKSMARRRPAIRPGRLDRPWRRAPRPRAPWQGRRRFRASPVMRVVPLASAPRINARCEQLLSPGMFASPRKGPPLRATSFTRAAPRHGRQGRSPGAR